MPTGQAGVGRRHCRIVTSGSVIQVPAFVEIGISSTFAGPQTSRFVFSVAFNPGKDRCNRTKLVVAARSRAPVPLLSR